MDNIKEVIKHIDWCVRSCTEPKIGFKEAIMLDGFIKDQQIHIKDLTDKLIKSNKDYCPERIGYEVNYKYIHEHCNGLDCDQCTRDQIDKGLNKGVI